MRASLAPSSLSPTAPTPSPAIGSLCRVAGFSEPIAQPGSRRLRSRRQRLRHRQPQLVRYAGLQGSANQLRSHRQQLIRYAGLPGSANQLCRLVRFESTALTYLATIPVYAATLPIRQMMPRPLALHQHVFFCVDTTIFFSQPRLRPDSILHSNQVDVPASTMQTHHASPSARASSYATTGEIPRTSRHDRTKFAPAHHHPHVCYAIGSHAVDYDVDHSAERVFLDFLSLPRLRLARRHTPLRYRFAHAVDHNVDDSADGLRPDSHQRSEEIDKARVTVTRLEPYVDSSRGGTSGRSPTQTPFTHSLS